MRWISVIQMRLRSLFFRANVDQELDEELRYHLEREIDEKITAGMKPEEARYAALRSVSNIEQRKEECRDMRGLSPIDNIAQDFRYAVRQLRKSPAFACTAIFVLALGISSTVAIFGFVEAALIKPLPYADQSRLVAAFESSPGTPRAWLSYADFADWKHLNSVFSSIDAYALNGSFTLNAANGAEQVSGTRVSAGFFHTLGVAPILGRDFRTGEDAPDAPPTVMLSYTAWQKRFGGNRDVLGRSLTVNGSPSVVIGVLPANFQFAPYSGDFWTTLRSTGSCEQHRSCHNLTVIARLKDGLSIQAASADMRSIAQQLQRQYPDTNRIFGGANLVPLRDFIVGDVRPVLLILLSGAGLLLLISCVNVTTLLLARSDMRGREIAVRGALGASASRLFRQFATEGFVLAAAGCILGLAFASWGIRLLISLVPAEKMDSMPYLRGLGLNPWTVAFACAISLLAAVLFALIPIARTSLTVMMEGLKEGARGSAGTTWRRFGSSLVIIEVALAMVLMVSAGLLGKSLYQLLHLDVGFRPDQPDIFPNLVGAWEVRDRQAGGIVGASDDRPYRRSARCNIGWPFNRASHRFRLGNRFIPSCRPTEPRGEQRSHQPASKCGLLRNATGKAMERPLFRSGGGYLEAAGGHYQSNACPQVLPRQRTHWKADLLRWISWLFDANCRDCRRHQRRVN